MITATCPGCESEISIGSNPDIGMRTKCPTCLKELEIVWLFPPLLDYREEENRGLITKGKVKNKEER